MSKTFKVYGNFIGTVSIEVEVTEEDLEEMGYDDYEEAAREIASENFSGLKNFVGNGGVDKLIGVTGSDESIEFGEGIDWEDCYETTA